MIYLRTRLAQLMALVLIGAVLAVVPGTPAQASGGSKAIYEIQGEGHISPFVGEGDVKTQGVVTAIGFRSFYVQDPSGDGNDATSDAMFVFDSRSSTFADVPGDYDPEEDGIDFYESLEGMLVTVEAPQAVSAIRQFGSFSAEFVVIPNGASEDIISPRDALTDRGGIFLQPHPDSLGDANPERVQIQLAASPSTRAA